MTIPILVYHSICDEKSNLSLNIAAFEKQIQYLKKNNFETINFNQINTSKVNKKIIITFDDGYKDILINALPILIKYHFTATCFLVANLIGADNKWDISKKNFMKKDLLSKKDINEWINNGMSIGSHSHNHKDLTNITHDDLKHELDFSKKTLEDLFGYKIRNFSYPFGKVNNEVYMAAKKTYDYAVTTNRSRYKVKKHNNLLIPRIDMGKNMSFFKIFLKLETIYEDIKFKKNEL